MNSLKELFAMPRYAGTSAVLVRCTHLTSGFNQAWLAKNKTGTWSFNSGKWNPETVIVLLDSQERGVVEIHAGRFTSWKPNKKTPRKGFFHVDYFELIGIAKKGGLQDFCVPYCKGPQPGPVYLERDAGTQSLDVKLVINSLTKDDFSPEFSGEKEGLRPGKYTANCTHGIVVNALYELLKKDTPMCVISNRKFYDLLKQDFDGERTLFEVKTTQETQSVYTGVGQLSMYNLTAHAKTKILVLPNGGEKWRGKLKIVDVQLWTYNLKDEKVEFFRPDYALASI
jgi:hypothetical protein